MPKQIPPEFWDDEQDDLYNLLEKLLRDAALAGAKTSLDQLVAMVGAGVDWGLINTAVAAWARSYTYDLVKEITQTSMAFCQTEISKWIESGKPLDDLMDALQPMFDETRAHMIAVTETTRAFAEGNAETWLASGLVQGYNVYTGEDELVCPICQDFQENGPYAIDDDSGRPPFHVNCRCYTQPVVEGFE